MTKEERAQKWFYNVPHAESISMETKMEICNKVAKKMELIFFIVIIVECVLLFIISDGKIFSLTADFLNNISKGYSTRNRYKGVALIGGLICFPVVVVPLLVVSVYKNRSLKSEAMKAIGTME
ncbi:hypothetical protein FYJ34_03190 [Clostridiaceae bacterium 68-1-5]|uniref:Uncharacterized protein n=1 Tax=Suipraeoptans intestinalis TaxID=2606628 RepID=A0A6N7V0B9_9FIRM|nr:hypothetical protein [Suipraeoptans intestinalis]MSR93296.1 hypothetical protein [Suipraeoptans intestinalis]